MGAGSVRVTLDLHRDRLVILDEVQRMPVSFVGRLITM